MLCLPVRDKKSRSSAHRSAESYDGRAFPPVASRICAEKKKPPAFAGGFPLGGRDYNGRPAGACLVSIDHMTTGGIRRAGCLEWWARGRRSQHARVIQIVLAIKKFPLALVALDRAFDHGRALACCGLRVWHRDLRRLEVCHLWL